MPEDKPAAPSAREALNELDDYIASDETLLRYKIDVGQLRKLSAKIRLALAEQVGEPEVVHLTKEQAEEEHHRNQLLVRAEEIWAEMVAAGYLLRELAVATRQLEEQKLSAAPDRRKG